MKIRFAALLLVLSASAAHADPRADVQHAFDAVIAAGGFRGHAQGNVLGPGTPSLSGEVDVVFPDRIRVASDALAFVALPQHAWINTFGVWTETDRALLPVTEFDMRAMRQAIAAIRDVAVTGAARTAGCPAHVFRFRSSGRLPGAPAAGDVRAWICDDSGKPARIEVQDSRGERLVFDFDWTRRPDVRAPR